MVPKPKIHILDFASAVLGLNLYPKQKELLTDLWDNSYNYGVYALGRRSGKTLLAQVSAAYAGTVMDNVYRQYLRKNEKFSIIAVANSEDQAGIALSGITQLIMDSPFAHMIVRKRDLFLELDNGAQFTGIPTSARAARGAACPLLIMDELAFSMGGSEVNSGGEAIYNAIAPAMAQFGKHGKLLALSSPGMKQGIFYKLYDQSQSVLPNGKKEFPNMFGARLPTWEVNPRISKDFLAAEKKRDPIMFNVEYGASWVSNALGLVDSRLVDESVDHIRQFGRPDPRYYGAYYLSLDPAKGNRDDYVACICHYEGKHFVVDMWHEFEATRRVLQKVGRNMEEKEVMQVDVKEVELWIKQMHQRWGFAQAVMDQYSSAGSIQALQDHIDIFEFIWSMSTKTKAYSKMRDLFNAGLMVLPPNEKGIQQIKGLTVQHRPNGQWSVSGGDGAAVDDYCAALAANILAMELPETETEWLDSLIA